MGRLGVIRISGPKGGKGKIFDDIRKRLKSPLTGGGGLLVAQAMRRGPGSVDDQFRQQSTFPRGGGRIRWKKTKPFGNRPAPAMTLVRSGGLWAAWTGRGAGSVMRRSARRVVIGVDSRRFPQAGRLNAFQAVYSKARKTGAQGKSAMHWLLGMKYGVWISDKKLRTKGLKVMPRRVSVNPIMLKRATLRLTQYMVDGHAGSARNI